jgi:hypothetical protein
MAKILKYIAIGLATTEFEPGQGEVISLAATGDGKEFLRVFSTEKDPVESKFWGKRTELLDRIYASGEATEVREGWKDFGEWLMGFQAKLVALTGGLDFWWVYRGLREHTGRCQFGSRYVDVGSFCGGRQGRLDGYGMVEIGTPMEVAKERYGLVAEDLPKVVVGRKRAPVVEMPMRRTVGGLRLPRYGDALRLPGQPGAATNWLGNAFSTTVSTPITSSSFRLFTTDALRG